MQENLLKLLLAISEGHGDEAAERAAEIGEKLETFDEAEFRRRVVGARRRVPERAGSSRSRSARSSWRCRGSRRAAGVRLPSELTMLGKTLLHLDEIGRTLDPTFDPNASVRRNAAELLQRRMRKSASPANLYASLLEAKDFVEKLPGPGQQGSRHPRQQPAAAERRRHRRAAADRRTAQDRQPDRARPDPRRADRRRRAAHAGADDLPHPRLSRARDPLLPRGGVRRRRGSSSASSCATASRPGDESTSPIPSCRI